MVLRIVAYTNLLWLQLIHEKKLSPKGLLPPIFPAVIYNGKPPWLAPVRLRDLIGLPEGSPLWPFQPDGQFFLIDQGRISPELLQQIEAVSALLFQIDQCDNPEELPRLVDELLQLIARRPEFANVAKILGDMLWYAMVTLTGESSARKNFPKNFLEMKIMIQENMKAWRDKKQQEWLQDGRKEGIKEGRAEMLIQLLQERFGLVPESVQKKVTYANINDQKIWASKIFKADSLQMVFQ